MSDDYYTILGVDKKSDITEIKKAYRKLALMWHPDKNNSPEAVDKFKKISEAYDTLSDSDKRKNYDTFGKQNMPHHMPFDPFEIFRRSFGEQFQMPNMFQQHFNMPSHFNMQQNNNIELVENLTLKEVFTGKKVSYSFNRNSPCQSCNGSGSDDGVERKCPTCHGQKQIHQRIQQGPFQMIQVIQCNTCQGSGFQNGTHSCKNCKGSKIFSEPINFNFSIPSGCIDGNAITIDNIGHIDMQTKKRDKVIIKINVLKHDKFLRGVTIDNKLRVDGYDLLMPIEISIADSLCGFTTSFTHIDDRNISFTVSDVVQNNSIYVINNEGLPNRENGKGKLIVMFKINYSENISNDNKKIIYEALTGKQYIQKETSSNITKIQQS
jgi:DnaJ-class molecular chaperone